MVVLIIRDSPIEKVPTADALVVFAQIRGNTLKTYFWPAERAEVGMPRGADQSPALHGIVVM